MQPILPNGLEEIWFWKTVFISLFAVIFLTPTSTPISAN